MPTPEMKAAAIAAMVEAEKNPQPETEEEGVIPLPDTSESTEAAEIAETEANAELAEEADGDKDKDKSKKAEKKAENEEDKPPAKTPEEQRKELAAERLAKALGRDERARAHEREAKQLRDAAANEREAVAAERKEIDQLKAQLKDPTTRIKAIESLGVTYEDYTRAYLNGSKRTAEDEAKEARQEVEAIKSELTKEREAIKQREYETAYHSELSAAAKVVDDNRDKYPTLYSENTEAQIKQKFAEAWAYIKAENVKRIARREQEKYFSHEELAEILENEEKPAYTEKQARRNKVGSKESVDHTASGSPAGKVITSDLSGGSSTRPMTWEEKRAKAIAMLP